MNRIDFRVWRKAGIGLVHAISGRRKAARTPTQPGAIRSYVLLTKQPPTFLCERGGGAPLAACLDNAMRVPSGTPPFPVAGNQVISSLTCVSLLCTSK